MCLSIQVLFLLPFRSVRFHINLQRSTTLSTLSDVMRTVLTRFNLLLQPTPGCAASNTDELLVTGDLPLFDMNSYIL